MARVKNWQLGREMEYEYDESRPQRQWAIVFDLADRWAKEVVAAAEKMGMNLRVLGVRSVAIALDETSLYGRGEISRTS